MSDDDSIIEDLLDRWEEAEEVGRPVTLDELCRDHPHLREALRHRIARLRYANGMLSDSNSETIPLAAPSGPEEVEFTARFRSLKFLSQGGLGRVFQAEDRQLRRSVAVKFLRKKHLTVPAACRRFEAEAEITSRLDHPGIVPIYGMGRTSFGQPFYVMRCLVGATLRDRVEQFHRGDARPLGSSHQVELAQLLSQFVLICRTLDYAHSRGVVHCDIKPDNIMVGQHGETVVLDWGLAGVIGRDEFHRTGDERTLEFTRDEASSVTGAGTPTYMSPEQHNQLPIGPASDIYALGATLYFMLSGTSAFNPQQAVPVIRARVVRGEFPRPRDVQRRLSPALEAIVLKAMSLTPEQRYPTAEALACDVERFLADERVEAYRESPLRTASRWMRRHRTATWATAGLLIAGLLGMSGYSAFVSNLAQRERRARVEATAARNESLRLAALFAAQSVGFRMNDRWRILEQEAAQPELIQRLEQTNTNPANTPWEQLDLWLTAIKSRQHDAAGQPESWFVCDATGRQVARFPASQASLNNSYAHRDYFHGNGADLAPGETGTPLHIEQPHRSKVYKSDSTGTLKVALTVPIWSRRQPSPDRTFLGILGMSVALGELIELQTGLGSQQIALVIDTATNVIDGRAVEGLILHHPRQNEAESPGSLLVIDGLALERMQQLVSAETPAEGTLLVDEFFDPLESGSSRPGVAWAAPVVVQGRPASEGTTGWVVVVAERGTNR